LSFVNGGRIGDSNISSNNSILVTGNRSLLSGNGGITVGYAGSGTLTVADGGAMTNGVNIASLSGSTGVVNVGRLGTNDTTGSLGNAPITFGQGSGTLNFNQSDLTILSNNIGGTGFVNQLGSGTTILSGNNSGLSGTTRISAGTMQAGSTSAFGNSAVTLTNTGTLALSTNLTISSLIWSSNSVMSLTPGAQELSIDGAFTSGGGGVFDFGGFTNNLTNTLITFGTNSGFNVSNFSARDNANWNFILNGNSLQAWYGANALIARTNNTIVTNTVTYPSVIFQTNGILTVTTSAHLTITSSVTVSNNGTVDVNGVLSTPAMIIPIGGTLGGSGTLSLTGGNLSVNGTLAPGNSPGTFFVSGGNLLMGTTSVWDQQIYSSSVYDQVVVTGSAILNGVMNITTFGSGGLQFGQKYNFLTASGGISGAFSSIVAPEGFRGRLLLSGNNTQANILIAPASYTQLAANRNQSNVATALNSFIPYASGDQQVVSTSLDSLTASQYNQAFNAIMPTFYQQIATIAFNNANAQNMQLVQRLWGLRVAEGGGFSMSGLADNMLLLEGQGDGKGVLDSKKDILRPGLDNHWGMFVDGNGIFAQANSGNMLPGYNSQSGGVTTGLTYKWNENVGTGIYCGYQGTYTKSGADGSGLGTGSSLIDNAVRFGVFGTYGQKDGKGLFVNALAGGGYHNFQATRVIQYAGMNRTANSAPGAGELDTMLAAGYDIKKGKFTFGPTASLQYTYLGVNSLNETGAQSLSFNSGGWNSSSMLSSVGAHAAYSWVAHKNILVVPQVNLSWQHEFMQNPYAISGNLGGTSPTFSNWSATPIRDYLYTGVGFTVEFSKRWNTSFFYNAAAGNSDLVSQNIFWSAGVKF
jgi:T5SS/PEP-CTERM-associated repeat protein/autotransporter-associated beta strand protein